MMYYVNWKLTIAQLELIAADVSVVDYNYGKDRKMKKGDYDNTPADAEKVRKAAKQWTEQYGDGKDAGKGLSIGDILSGGMKVDVGVKISG